MQWTSKRRCLRLIQHPLVVVSGRTSNFEVHCCLLLDCEHWKFRCFLAFCIEKQYSTGSTVAGCSYSHHGEGSNESLWKNLCPRFESCDQSGLPAGVCAPRGRPYVAWRGRNNVPHRSKKIGGADAGKFASIIVPRPTTSIKIKNVSLPLQPKSLNNQPTKEYPNARTHNWKKAPCRVPHTEEPFSPCNTAVAPCESGCTPTPNRPWVREAASTKRCVLRFASCVAFFVLLLFVAIHYLYMQYRASCVVVWLFYVPCCLCTVWIATEFFIPPYCLLNSSPCMLLIPIVSFFICVCCRARTWTYHSFDFNIHTISYTLSISRVLRWNNNIFWDIYCM